MRGWGSERAAAHVLVLPGWMPGTQEHVHTHKCGVILAADVHMCLPLIAATGAMCIARIAVEKPICIEAFDNVPQVGAVSPAALHLPRCITPWFCMGSWLACVSST